jgi:hypothetical protein
MRKSDLENGMVVQTESGNNYMVVGDKFIRNEGFLHISDFQNDLTLKGEKPLNGFDIIEVYAEIVALKHLNDNTKTLIWIRL